MNTTIDTKGLNGRLVKNTIAVWLLVIGMLFYFLIVGSSCNDDGVELIPTVQLNVVDVGVTEAWLRITLNTDEGMFALKRNDSIISTLHSPIDTVLYNEGLLPKHTYTYKTERGTSLVVTTMDTTSHDFTWDVTTLGDGNSSVLYDVAIVNDTCVYAVGEIYKKDSTGQFEYPNYALASWNGIEWKLMAIQSQPGPTGYRSDLAPKGIVAFSRNDIWLTAGGVHHFNGEYVDRSYWINYFPGNPNPIWQSGQYANRLWGTSSSNLYVAGTNGALAHYNGSSWKKIESGTTTNINDAWGVQNPLNRKEEVYCAVTDFLAGKEKKLFKITNGNKVDSINWSPQRHVVSIWTNKGYPLYACGDGIF